MYGFEGIHASQPYGYSNLTYTVPTPTERLGNFADLLAYGSSYQIYDPATTKPSTTSGRYTRSTFPGNVIPQARLSQTALNIIGAYYPLPNLPGAKPTGVNYTMPSIQANDFDNHAFRLDHAIGQKHRLFVRATVNQRAQAQQLRFAGGAGYNGERDNQGIGIDDAYIMGRSLIVDVRYNYTRYVDNYQPPTAGLDLTTLGFSQTYVDQIRSIDPRNLMLPDITPTGYPELNAQARRASPATYTPGEWISLTPPVPHHALRLRVPHLSRFQRQHRPFRRQIEFQHHLDAGPARTTPRPRPSAMAGRFLLGLPTDGSFDMNPSLAQQYQVSGSYVQDTWKVGPRVTVSAGVRWEYEIPLTERYNRSVRDFDPAPGCPLRRPLRRLTPRPPSRKFPRPSSRWPAA